MSGENLLENVRKREEGTVAEWVRESSLIIDVLREGSPKPSTSV